MAGGYKECSTIGAELSAGATYWNSTKKYSDYAATDKYPGNIPGNYPEWKDVFDDTTMLPGCTLPPKVRLHAAKHGLAFALGLGVPHSRVLRLFAFLHLRQF